MKNMSKWWQNWQHDKINVISFESGLMLYTGDAMIEQ